MRKPLNRKRSKRNRPAADLPTGFRDYFGESVRVREGILNSIAQVFHKFGFDPLDTPAIEYLDALGKFLPDLDRPNEGVFAWKEDEKWLSLRYDLTAPLARVAAQYRNQLPTPFRRYAMGPVWRNEKPGPGRFRQFIQCDADTVGASSIGADAELVVLAAEILETVGLGGDDYHLRINSRKVLDGVMIAAGVYDESESSLRDDTRGAVFRAIDKLDRLGLEGVRSLLGEGRLDQSGDFTPGAGLSPDQIDIILSFLELERDNKSSTLDTLRHMVRDTDVGSEGVFELVQIAEILESQNFPSNKYSFDPSVVRGLGYYTGPVLEAELTFEVLDRRGQVRQFGSVAGGGRYDELVKRFTGHAVPATGISIGIDRLLAALEARQGVSVAETGPVLVTIMDRPRLPEYQAMVAELRKAGVRSELFLGNARNIGKQLRYADLRKCPIAIIQGDIEKEMGVVQIKDLVEGAKAARTASHDEWKSRTWQYEVTRENLVEKVVQLMKNHRQGH